MVFPEMVGGKQMIPKTIEELFESIVIKLDEAGTTLNMAELSFLFLMLGIVMREIEDKHGGEITLTDIRALIAKT